LPASIVVRDVNPVPFLYTFHAGVARQASQYQTASTLVLMSARIVAISGCFGIRGRDIRFQPGTSITLADAYAVTTKVLLQPGLKSTMNVVVEHGVRFNVVR
jgi:hypothetical protein